MLSVLERPRAVGINLAYDAHRVLVKVGIHYPFRSLAAHLHHDAQGFENLVVALQSYGDIVVAYWYC